MADLPIMTWQARDLYDRYARLYGREWAQQNWPSIRQAMYDPTVGIDELNRQLGQAESEVRHTGGRVTDGEVGYTPLANRVGVDAPSEWNNIFRHFSPDDRKQIFTDLAESMQQPGYLGGDPAEDMRPMLQALGAEGLTPGMRRALQQQIRDANAELSPEQQAATARGARLLGGPAYIDPTRRPGAGESYGPGAYLNQGDVSQLGHLFGMGLSQAGQDSEIDRLQGSFQDQLDHLEMTNAMLDPALRARMNEIEPGSAGEMPHIPLMHQATMASEPLMRVNQPLGMIPQGAAWAGQAADYALGAGYGDALQQRVDNFNSWMDETGLGPGRFSQVGMAPAGQMANVGMGGLWRPSQFALAAGGNWLANQMAGDVRYGGSEVNIQHADTPGNRFDFGVGGYYGTPTREQLDQRGLQAAQAALIENPDMSMAEYANIRNAYREYGDLADQGREAYWDDFNRRRVQDINAQNTDMSVSGMIMHPQMAMDQTSRFGNMSDNRYLARSRGTWRDLTNVGRTTRNAASAVGNAPSAMWQATRSAASTSPSQLVNNAAARGTGRALGSLGRMMPALPGVVMSLPGGAETYHRQTQLARSQGLSAPAANASGALSAALTTAGTEAALPNIVRGASTAASAVPGMVAPTFTQGATEAWNAARNAQTMARGAQASQNAAMRAGRAAGQYLGNAGRGLAQGGRFGRAVGSALQGLGNLAQGAGRIGARVMNAPGSLVRGTRDLISAGRSAIQGGRAASQTANAIRSGAQGAAAANNMRNATTMARLGRLGQFGRGIAGGAGGFVLGNTLIDAASNMDYYTGALWGDDQTRQALLDQNVEMANQGPTSGMGNFAQTFWSPISQIRRVQGAARGANQAWDQAGQQARGYATTAQQGDIQARQRQALQQQGYTPQQIAATMRAGRTTDNLSQSEQQAYYRSLGIDQQAVDAARQASQDYYRARASSGVAPSVVGDIAEYAGGTGQRYYQSGGAGAEYARRNLDESQRQALVEAASSGGLGAGEINAMFGTNLNANTTTNNRALADTVRTALSDDAATVRAAQEHAADVERRSNQGVFSRAWDWWTDWD